MALIGIGRGMISRKTLRAKRVCTLINAAIEMVDTQIRSFLSLRARLPFIPYKKEKAPDFRVCSVAFS